MNMVSPSAIGSKIFGVGSDAMINPINRYAQYVANTSQPNLRPSYSELVDYYLRSDMTSDSLRNALEVHGIAKPNGFQGTPTLWTNIIKRKTNIPSWEILLAMLFRGIGDKDAIEWFMECHGYKDTKAYDMMKNQPTIWSPEQARILHAIMVPPISRVGGDAGAGDWGQVDPSEYVPLINKDDYNSLLKASGMHLSNDRSYFEQLIQPPTYHECILARNRDIIDDATFRHWIALEGFTDSKAIDCLQKLRAEIPSVSELVEFSVKNVFSKEITERFGYDDEYREIPSYHIWMRRNGYIGNPTLSEKELKDMVDSKEITQEAAHEFAENQDPKLLSWAQAHWRAHWINPSPSQAYAMLHRLRPNNSLRPGPRVPNVPGAIDKDGKPVPVESFTMSDVSLILRANDYVPLFRSPLAAISYNVLRLVDIRRVVELSLRSSDFQDRTIGLPPIYDDGKPTSAINNDPTDSQRVEYLTNWAKENFLDRGQTPEAAVALAELALESGKRTISVPHRAKIKEWRKRSQKLAERSYVTSRITKDQYVTWSHPEDFQQFGPRKETIILDQEIAQVNYERALRATRADFIDGAIDTEQAVTMLTSAGMVVDKIGDVLRDWSSSMNLRHSLARTSNVLKWYNEELIDKDDARNRLQRLGWSKQDSLLEVDLPPPKGSARYSR